MLRTKYFDILVFPLFFLFACSLFVPSLVKAANGVDGAVNTLLVQPDGKIVIGGSFGSYDDVPRNSVARLTMSGSLDMNFDPGSAFSSSVPTYINSIAAQSTTGVFLAGNLNVNSGNFQDYGVVNVTSDGTLNTSFHSRTGLGRWIDIIATQSDGKPIVSGPSIGLRRLNLNGTFDSTFSGGSVSVKSIAFQTDGKIIIAGGFTNFNGTPRNRIARLNPNGSLDTTFNPGAGANAYTIFSAAIQPDGKIIIGGNFTTYDNISRNRIARLNSDGTLDTTFDPGTGMDGEVSAISIQPDGKIVVGGYFSDYNGTPRNRIARLNPNGSLDTTFNPGAGVSDWIRVIAIQPDGKIVIGGYFTKYNGVAVNNVARLNVDGTLDTSFGSSISAERKFTPDLDGYSFNNWGNTDPGLDWRFHLFSDVFGTLSPAVTSSWVNNSRTLVYFGLGGDCFGMSLASAKEFSNITNFIPNNQVTSNISKPDIATIWDEEKWKWVSMYDGSKVGENPSLMHIIEDHLSQAADIDFESADKLFEDGINPLDYILSIHNNDGPHTGGHALLPYRVEVIIPNKKYDVFVYDSNHSGGDNQVVHFEKLDNGKWERQYQMFDGDSDWNWIDQDVSAIQLTGIQKVASFDYSTHNLPVSKFGVVNGASTALLVDTSGRKTGYDEGTYYTEIPGVTVYTPTGINAYGDGVDLIEFRGDLDQDLNMHVVASPQSDDPVSVLKWESSGYIELTFQDGVAEANLYFSEDNSTVTVSASEPASYNIEIDGVSEGDDHILNAEATLLDEHTVQTFSVDWPEIFGGNSGFTFENDIDGDGIAESVQHVEGMSFSDTIAPVSISTLSGTLLAPDTYFGPTTITITAEDNSGGVGVERTEYSYDGDVWGVYKDPIVVSQEGTTTVYYRSIDWFGNVEDAQQVSFEIVSAVGLIEQAETDLSDTTFSDKKAQQAISVVNQQLELSLKPDFWLDRNTFRENGGDQSTAHLKNALSTLDDVLSGKGVYAKVVLNEAERTALLHARDMLLLAQQAITAIP